VTEAWCVLVVISLRGQHLLHTAPSQRVSPAGRERGRRGQVGVSPLRRGTFTTRLVYMSTLAATLFDTASGFTEVQIEGLR